MSLRVFTSKNSLPATLLDNCQLARELEDAGKYDDAASVLSDYWQGVGHAPQIEGLGEYAKAEVLLRVGVLTGFIGSARQIENSQEAAKDLISQSIPIFSNLRLKAKEAEAYINLGRCYQREGSFDEARVLLCDVLSSLTEDEPEVKARGTLLLALVEKEANRPHDALSIHVHAKTVFEKCPNATLKGSHHNEYAIVLRRLGSAEKKSEYIDLALVEYAAASFYFEQAGHIHYAARVENNVGYLLFSLGRLNEAHEHLSRARQWAERVKDRSLIAIIDDSRANVFLAEGRNAEAEKVSGKSVCALEGGGENILLAESLRTHGSALARIGDVKKAAVVLRRAVDTSNTVEDNSSAGMAWLVMLEELFEHLSSEQKHIAFKEASRLLGTTQDPAISNRLLTCASRLVTAFSDMKPDTEQNIPVPTSTEEWEKFSLKDAVTDYEKMIIQRAMTDAGGVVKRAARYLKIDHQLLFSKLKNKHRDLKHLKTNNPTSARRSIMLVKPSSKNVSLMPDTFQICLPPGQTYGYIEVASDKLASKGVQRNDLLVWAKSEAQEHELVAVRISVKAQRTPAKYEYGHLIYESPKRIKLKTDEGESMSFDIAQVSIEGRVVGYCKAADVEKCRQSFESGEGCLPLEVHKL